MAGIVAFHLRSRSNDRVSGEVCLIKSKPIEYYVRLSTEDRSVMSHLVTTITFLSSWAQSHHQLNTRWGALVSYFYMTMHIFLCWDELETVFHLILAMMHGLLVLSGQIRLSVCKWRLFSAGVHSLVSVK